MAESRTVAALSVVMNVLQLDERRALREENARLKEELAEWKGDYLWKPEPEVGKYYVFGRYELSGPHMDDHELAMRLGDDSIAMRFDGTELGEDDRILWIFTSPFDEHELYIQNKGYPRGPIKNRLETHELHDVCKLQENDLSYHYSVRMFPAARGTGGRGEPDLDPRWRVVKRKWREGEFERWEAELREWQRVNAPMKGLKSWVVPTSSA